MFRADFHLGAGRREAKRRGLLRLQEQRLQDKGLQERGPSWILWSFYIKKTMLIQRFQSFQKQYSVVSLVLPRGEEQISVPIAV